MNYTFRVATHAGDYRACRALAAAENMPANRLSFPTIMGFEGAELTGFLATDTSQDMVVAGPLVIKSGGRRPRLALKLAENYELAMRNLGIKSFIMAVQPNSTMAKAVERYGFDMTKYGEKDGWLFYLRRLEWAVA